MEAYLSLALAHHPEAAAGRAHSQAALDRIAGQRALPEPVVSVGAALQPVETRVGPQQVRLGVRQAIPWPSRLVQSGRAAEAEADGAAQALDATLRALSDRVEGAYWSLWQVRASRALHTEHLTILDGLAATVRARVEVGSSSLADLQQVELSRSWLEDALASLDAQEAIWIARLRAATGADVGEAPTDSAPSVARAGLRQALHDRTGDHPQLRALDAGAQAADHRARATAAQRLPSATLGADWIVTGPARADGVDDSGRDAVSVGLGLTVPLWQGAYRHELAAAWATAEGIRQQRRAQADQLGAEVDEAIARLEDSARRVALIEDTLLPQAEAAYQALLGEYTVGRAQVAQILLTQRDLLALGVQRVEAQADNERSGAQLAALAGEAP